MCTFQLTSPAFKGELGGGTEGWRDDENIIESASVFILDPVKATAVLKTRSLDEIECFLWDDAVTFFERYEAGGGGKAILKTKFAANKPAILAKFAELTAHLKQLRAAQPTPPASP